VPAYPALRDEGDTVALQVFADRAEAEAAVAARTAFLSTIAHDLRTPITAIRLASEVPESERTPLQVLRTDSKTFAAATEARRNRRDGWYLRPAGHIDLCNVPLPVRTSPTR